MVKLWGIGLLFFVFIADAGEYKGAPLKYDIDASGGLIPYDFTGDPKNPGIYAELIPLLMANAGIAVQATELPIKRAVLALERGMLDFDFVSPDWFSQQGPGHQFLFSDALFKMTENFYCLEQKAATYPSLDNVWGNIVGTVFGYYYASEAKFRRMDFRSEKFVVEGLASRRFQVAILESVTAQFWSNELDVKLHNIGQHTSGDIVLRLRQQHSSLMPQINKAIEQLHERQQINDIVEKYRSLGGYQ